MTRKIAEAGDSGPILEYVKTNARTDAAQVRLKARVAGLVNIAVGAGLMIFLHELVPASAVYLVGLIPLFIGVVLLIFTELMMKPAD
jgi:cadmium resistance protein CadD (predicted permease)